MDNRSISFCAVGDIRTARANPDEIFDLVRPIFGEADFIFGNCEGLIRDKDTLQPGLISSLPLMDPVCLLAFKNAGFKVMSCVGNHSMDYVNFLDTVDGLRKNGITPFGMGKDLEEARKPAILDIKGTRVGFLTRNAASNQFPFNFRATPGRPGTAALRVYSSFETRDTQAGIPPVVHTWPDEGDIKEVIDDIQKLRPQVDVLVWTPHWGLHYIPMLLGEYEINVGHQVIDAGADLIIGHHPHILKGIEVYKGKAIIYSMGNFIFENMSAAVREIVEKYGPGNVTEELIARYNAPTNSAGIYRPSHDTSQIPGIPKRKYDPEYPYWTAPPLARRAMIVKCSIVNKQIQKLSIVPTQITKVKCQPEPLSVKSSDGSEVMKFIQESSDYFNTKFTVEGDEAVLVIK